MPSECPIHLRILGASCARQFLAVRNELAPSLPKLWDCRYRASMNRKVSRNINRSPTGMRPFPPFQLAPFPNRLDTRRPRLALQLFENRVALSTALEKVQTTHVRAFRLAPNYTSAPNERWMYL